MTDITVRGHVRRRVPPSEATVHVTVRAADATDLGRAVAQAGERCARVDAVIAEHRGSLVSNAATQSLRTGKEYEHTQKGRRVIGYYAVRSTELECQPDGPGLTILLTALSRLDGVSLSGPHWSVHPDSPAMEAMRVDAAADARRRAEAYARGLGLNVGRPLWIAEPGLRQQGGPGGVTAESAPSARRMRAASADAGDEDDGVPVTIEAESVPSSVTVEACFTVDEG